MLNRVRCPRGWSFLTEVGIPAGLRKQGFSAGPSSKPDGPHAVRVGPAPDDEQASLPTGQPPIEPLTSPCSQSAPERTHSHLFCIFF